VTKQRVVMAREAALEKLGAIASVALILPLLGAAAKKREPDGCPKGGSPMNLSYVAKGSLSTTSARFSRKSKKMGDWKYGTLTVQVWEEGAPEPQIPLGEELFSFTLGNEEEFDITGLDEIGGCHTGKPTGRKRRVLYARAYFN